jgi:VIT1/CCC1 family predicted Fe2+/Mn2+ transporter
MEGADVAPVLLGEAVARLLDPVDRISEIMFGLIMAVTIVGSLSIATAGKAEVRTVMFAALGCNVAWGLVDAFMYLVRIATERSRLRTIARDVRVADSDHGRLILERALPEHLAPLLGRNEIETMRARLVARPVDDGPVLRARMFFEAFAIFVMVVLGTFPVVLPFLFIQDTRQAFHYSQAITLVMLFIAGLALGRHAVHPRPVRTGLAMAVFGAVLIAAVKALGG